MTAREPRSRLTEWIWQMGQRGRALRQRIGGGLCRAGFHALRAEAHATVDDAGTHEETCRRCGHTCRVPYSGI